MKRNQIKLRLPFRGNWFVNWGGDTKEQNQHHDVSNQKYAFDFVVLGTGNLSYKITENNNENYYAFGEQILAPANGVVVNIIDSIPDNIPGETNQNSISGNAILIEHRDNEVSVLAHLKHGSIRVKPGEKVKLGQRIGECGNSGNSTEPHLHYHLQEGRDLYSGEGIKCFFKDVCLNNENTLEEYSPVMNDIISNSL